MKRNTLAKKLTAGLLTGAMVLSMGGMTAFAAPANGELKQDLLTKYLVMDKDANVPKASISYTIGPGTAVDAENGKPAVKPGVGSDDVVIEPSVFSPGMTTSMTPEGILSLGQNQKYAKVTSDIDFSSVQFTEPGIYRYVIDETAPTEPGITERDPNAKIYLDVYVTSNDSGVLEAKGYILHKTTEVGNAEKDGDYGYTDTDEKTTGFINDYATSNLTLEKKVTGNQGNREQYFQFNVNITNAVPGTQYTVDITDAPSQDNVGKELITVSDNGTATATYYLKNEDSIRVLGLTGDTKCTITEVLDATEGYTTSNDHDNTNADGSGLTTDEITIDKDGEVVIFTNNRDVVTPTGIAMTFAPYAVMVAFAGVFAVMFLRKKREDF